MIMGEIALDGSIRPIKGALPIAIQTLEDGFKGFILPNINAEEATIVKGIAAAGGHNIILIGPPGA